VTLELGDTGVDLTVVTRNEAHCQQVIATITAHGFPVQRLA